MNLKHYLDGFLDSFPKERHVETDPVQFVHRYSDPADREVVGFVAAAFSYGNVKSVIRSVERVVARLGDHPAQFIASFDPRRDARVFRGFYHRWNTGQDVAVLLWILARMIEEHGSLQAAIAGGIDPRNGSVATGLERFSSSALSFGHAQFYSEAERCHRLGVLYFFPKVSDGSACKRLNLFMRWMVRPDDGVDCGVWDRIAPGSLVIPLDTHISRISQYIGLTEMRTPGWRMAVDVTDSLRKLDPADPLRYDFALCHLGIAGDCPRRRDFEKCVRCPIQKVCRL